MNDLQKIAEPIAKPVTRVERIWHTPSGLIAAVIMTDLGHRCGYVGVPAGHPLYGAAYSDETLALKPPEENTPVGERDALTLLGAAIKGRLTSAPEVVFDVHGGVTYAGTLSHLPVKVKESGASLWWFGYDCGHCDDAPAPEHTAWLQQTYPGLPVMWETWPGRVHRTLDYCIDQCNSLAEQIETMTRSRFDLWCLRLWLKVKGR